MPSGHSLNPFLLAIRGQGGRPASNYRLVLDGIFWIARTGAAWHDLPEEFGTWSSVYRQFRRWTLGLWELVIDALNDSGAVPDNVQMIDSTVIRAHHLAAGAKACPEPVEGGGTQRQGFGRSKGGFTSKIHLITPIISGAHGLPVRAEITGGEVCDFKGFDALVNDALPS